MTFISKIASRGAVLALALAGSIGAAHATDISGAGATFPYPIYGKWADDYKKTTGIGLNYQSIGSGGGIKQIKAKTVTFGASDKPLTAEELAADDLIQWPMIMGGVVPVVNLGGIAPGQIVIDGPTLAKMYMGEITTWNAPEIAKLNPGVNLPSTAIAPIYRSDGSGTNFLFTTYLSSVLPEFKEKIGANTSVEWPAGIGAKGNEGVANMTKQTDGAVGYVEYAYAKQNSMTYLKMVNAAGKTVAPEIASFQAAAANADWEKAPGLYLVLTNQPGDKSWPITGASFILMHKKVDDANAANVALRFFTWAYKNGGAMAEGLDYVPMPENVQKMVVKLWTTEIVGPDGKPVYEPK
ncbi:phosphate ABC transporter substrate-binding protein PstS [Zavarzinia sp.]|uniref:phosphate ABC transporter substrate-binding protein PstS n=1 Tax=Zavarzinia sp. TaxID=2027920 RepID=UPI00356325A9